MTTTNFKEQYTEEEKGEAIMTEQVETIEEIEEMEQVVTHYGETIQQHSVEWYKKQLLKDWSVQFIKDSLLPQLLEWSNAYKAAVELTK